MQRRSSSVNVSLEEGSHRVVPTIPIPPNCLSCSPATHWRARFPPQKQDVGVLELVADPQTGKRGIRRVFPETMKEVQPDPDTTSTVHPNGDGSGGGGGTETGRRRPSLAIRTQTDPQPLPPPQPQPLPQILVQAPGLPRQATTSTRQDTMSTGHSTNPKPPQRLNVMRALRDSFTWKHDPNDRGHDRPLDIGSPITSGLPYANGSIQALGNAWKGKEKEVAGLFQDNEGDKLSVVMDDARKNRLATKAREIREWMKGRSMHRGANANTTVNANAHANANDNSNGPTNVNAIQNNNKKPGASNTGGGVRDLFKGRRQNTMDVGAAGSSKLQAPASGLVPPTATPTTAHPRKDQGPKPGQTYEIYEQRIIENNPERTVEISTWREQLPVKKSTSDQQDKISIYYISADEYPPEDRPMAKVEWHVDGGEMSPIVPGSPMSVGSPHMLGASIHGRPHRPSHPRHGSSYHSRASESRNRHSYHGHALESPTARKDRGAHNAHKSVKRPPLPHSGTGSRTANSSRVASPITPSRTRDGTISPSSSERDLSVTPTVKMPVPQPAQQQHSGSKFVENITAPSSPIARRASQASAPQRGLRHTSRRDLFPSESTPVATVSQGPPASAKGAGPSGLAPPSINGTGASGGRSVSAPPSSSPPVLTVVTTAPFNPTRESGSAISSIKSVPSVQFEALLQSCEPSLAHIAPALRQLGIRHLEHLRAVGKLTPTTRDREVKEGALKLGITVMEWAILLDRIIALL
ncbi:hypothetical protein D9619_013189 [Psilocybe cf. subviscida]|uniref:Uncharacterized protein n=1 Tax=Psilocybe cf. subviscida TaxID=2480587 RepID=A0A8H5B6Q8_9AGAR|nr:hypothetical protein D9619_013189 [Psilocybe cf. subviscida]